MALSWCRIVPRIHLILQTARTKGYTKVMTGETCTRVAIKLLTNLALGRGAFLAVDTVSSPLVPCPLPGDVHSRPE